LVAWQISLPETGRSRRAKSTYRNRHSKLESTRHPEDVLLAPIAANLANRSSLIR